MQHGVLLPTVFLVSKSSFKHFHKCQFPNPQKSPGYAFCYVNPRGLTQLSLMVVFLTFLADDNSESESDSDDRFKGED